MRQSTIRGLNAIKPKDFFGIHDITNKDIAGAFASKTKLANQEIEKKYDPLLKSRNRLASEEKDENHIFGRIRFDSDNIPKKHGQYDESKSERLYDTIQVKQMFVPDEAIKSISTLTEGVIDQPDPQYGLPFKISEVEPVQSIGDILQIFKSNEDNKRLVTVYKNKPPITFYFDKAQVKTAPANPSHQKQTLCDPKPESKNSQPEYDIRRPQVDLDAQAGTKGARAALHELDIMSEEFQERQDEERNEDRFDRSLDRKYDVNLDDGTQVKPMKALTYLNKVREKEIEPSGKRLKERLAKNERPHSFKPLITLDSQGHRIYTHQVPDWSSIRRVDILEFLQSSIIYNNYDILAINKPYGLASHSSPGDKGGLDVNSLMCEIAKQMRIDTIYLAHRLDKTTTGTLLFATSKERAQKLNKLFKADEVKKTYWCITAGVPDPPVGVIDLPIADIEVAGKLRSCPAPAYLNDDKHLARKFREARRAITEYRVIDTKPHVALLELKPRSGVKHQLRCHMGFGLKTPILGDHKYSNLTKLAPQKLAPSILKSLHVRQSKVRTLPMHLHAKSIVIPGAKANGETLFINSPLPRHFVDNLRSLKLSSQD